MQNTDIFKTYDMVVALTQKTINDQLRRLLALGVIRDKLIITKSFDANGNFSYEVLENEADIPGFTQGKPTVAFINGDLLPQISIDRSGTDVSFRLNFVGGTAGFYAGPVIRQHDMTGWTYAIDIDLDLLEISREDLQAHKAVPAHVKQQLTQFQDQFFTVNSLFVDFESVNLLKFNPTKSTAGAGGDAALQDLVLFMQFYLGGLKKDNNPYILGYSLSTSDKTEFKPNQKVPASLRPVGATFNVFHDPVSPARSTLNFLIVTEEGSGPIRTRPQTFDTNWISPAEQVDGKLIYSEKRFMTPLILEPYYDAFQSGVFEKIRNQISVNAGNTYAQGTRRTANGYGFVVSDQDGGHDKYKSSYQVEFDAHGDDLNVSFRSGSLYVYKQKNKDIGPKIKGHVIGCTAKFWVDGTINWNGAITLSATKDASGEPIVKPAASMSVTSYPDWKPHENSCAKAAGILALILGSILDSLTGGLDRGFFTNLIERAIQQNLGDFGPLADSVQNIGQVSTIVYLPAGDVFAFKDPAADPAGNFSLGLTYQSQT